VLAIECRAKGSYTDPSAHEGRGPQDDSVADDGVGGASLKATGFVCVCGRCVAWVCGVALAPWLKPCPSPDFGGYCSLGSLGVLSFLNS
jgi:hypothetical protein